MHTMETQSDNAILTESGFGQMGRDAKKKIRNDNDFRALIVGQNSQTGIGKTTLAVQLCRYIDETEDGWSADKKAFIEVDEYIDAHLDYPKQSCLMLDEIEAGADNRRATSHDNVNLSHAWMTMRARNIATIATLPSTDTLDSRMLMLSDYWVLVKSRGVAQPFKINVNDFNGKVQRQPVMNDQHITFPDLPSDDDDKQYLDSIKDDMLRGLTEESQKVPMPEHKERVKKAKGEAMEAKRNEMIWDIYNNTDLSTTDLGQLETTEVSQSQVSRIINNYEETKGE